MKLNLKTIALGSLAVMALIATPIALVQSADAEANSRREAHLEQLNLTEAQSAQIETIRTNTRSQIEAVLTPEQRSELEESDSLRKNLRALDLSDEQRSQIRTIHEDSREQIEAVLTEDQRQMMAQRVGGEGRHGGEGREGRHGDEGSRRGGPLEDLNLTDEQSAQIEAIRSDARSQSEALLTAEQRATLGDKQGRDALRSLDLTDQQREQIRAIHEASHERINAILTEEQRQQLPARPERRQGESSTDR